MRQTTHFTYYRCRYGHGRFTPYAQFLREKNFIRPLEAAEMSRLRAAVSTVRCVSCGGPVPIDRVAVCPYCGAPVMLLDPEAVAKALKELETLQGKWMVQRIETRDTKHDVGEGEPIALTIKGTKWTFGTFQEGKVVALDPTTNPKTMDLKSIRKGREDTLNEAVYKVTGGVMVVVIYQGKDKKRPTSLDRPTEANTVRWTLKRAKK